MLLTLVFLAAPGEAQEATEVERALEQLQDALRNDQSLDPAVRAALSALVEAFKAERAGAVPRPAEPTPGITPEQVAPAVDEYLETKEEAEETGLERLTDRLNFSGDFRLRHESSVNQDTSRDRHRERIRLRVGGTYDVNDQLTFGARVITGDPEDPQTANQTLGNVFHSFDISLDRAYLTYEPLWAPNGWVTAGKFGFPLTRNPVFGQLLWDSDVQPEGIVFGHTFDDHGRLEQLRFVAGQFLVEERSGADDATAFVVQGAGRLALAETWKADLALSYFLYSGIETAGDAGFSSTDNAGNAVFDSDGDLIPDRFVSDFEILNPMVAVTWDGWKIPLTVSGEYIKNFEANIDGDQGWAVGAALGTAKNKGDWRLYYQYQLIEQDAVFSPVAQAEFLFSTNFKGHVFGAQYQLTKQIQLHGWTLVSERDEPNFAAGQTDQTQWRIRGDLLIRF